MSNFDDAFGQSFTNEYGQGDSPDQNVMQQAGSISDPSQVGQPAAPSQAAFDPNSYAPQVSQPGIDGSMQAQPANAMQQAVQPPRQRASLLDVLRQVGNFVLASNGQQPIFHSDAQQAQAKVAAEQALQAGALKNQQTAGEIAQTGVQTQTAQNDLLHGFAQGLQSIKNAGGDPTIAAPVLAKQMGIPTEQAQAVIEQYQRDPANTLQSLQDATDSSVAKGGGAKYANQPLFMRDAQGNLHVMQLSNGGGMQEAQGPAGMSVVLPGVKMVDQGTQQTAVDKFGNPIKTFQVAGKPETGTTPDGHGGYQALPGTTRQLTNVKTQQAIDAAAQKLNDAKQAKVDAYTGSLAALDAIERNINSLDKLSAQPSSGGNVIGNATNYFQGTHAGQAIGGAMGTQAQQARNNIKAAAQALMLSAAKGNGQLFRNQTEQQNFLNSINNPTASIKSMRDALALARARVGAPPPGYTSPTSGWGKAQRVQ